MKRFVAFLAFMIIWISGCAMADYIFEIEDNSIAMAWGYIVAMFGFGVSDAIKDHQKIDTSIPEK